MSVLLNLKKIKVSPPKYSNSTSVKIKRKYNVGHQSVTAQEGKP
jgi:hypothetical protein